MAKITAPSFRFRRASYSHHNTNFFLFNMFAFTFMSYVVALCIAPTVNDVSYFFYYLLPWGWIFWASSNILFWLLLCIGFFMVLLQFIEDTKQVCYNFELWLRSSKLYSYFHIRNERHHHLIDPVSYEQQQKHGTNCVRHKIYRYNNEVKKLIQVE